MHRGAEGWIHQLHLGCVGEPRWRRCSRRNPNPGGGVGSLPMGNWGFGGFLGLRLENTEKWMDIDYVNIPLIWFFFGIVKMEIYEHVWLIPLLQTRDVSSQKENSCSFQRGQQMQIMSRRKFRKHLGGGFVHIMFFMCTSILECSFPIWTSYHFHVPN